MNKISVIVCCYKPDFKKLKKTLYSVFLQKNMEVEVVIADDGTPDINYSFIKEYIEHNLKEGFSVKYSLLHKNVGTIKNIKEALNLVSSKYVKLISPGDYLNSDHALKDYYEKLEESDAKVVFADTICYTKEDKDIKFVPLRAPLINIYRKHYSINKALRNILLCRDNILGASMAYDTSFLKKSLDILISNDIRFGEDSSAFISLLEHRKIAYINKTLMWYECDSGLSSGAAPSPLLMKDRDNIYNVLLPKYRKKYKVVDKTLKYFDYRNSHGKLRSYMHFLLISPINCICYIAWLLKAKRAPRKIKFNFAQQDFDNIFKKEID